MKKKTRKRLIEEILGTDVREFEQYKFDNFIDFYTSTVTITPQQFQELVDVLGVGITVDILPGDLYGAIGSLLVTIEDVDFSIKKPRIVTAHGD